MNASSSNSQSRQQTTTAQRSRPLSGWGNCPVQRCLVYRPESEQEVARLVTNIGDSSLIARGLGRSYGDAALNQVGGVILCDRNSRFIAFDERSGLLECEAGLSLADINTVLLPRGFFLPVTPGTQYVTMGGALAADVHGKNHHRCGTIATFVRSFRLLTAQGTVLDCSRQRNPELFWATMGGMGLTGIILTVTLEMLAVESSFMTVDYERVANLDQALERFAQTDATSTYSVAWIDCLARGRSLGRSVLMRGEHARRDELRGDLLRTPLRAPRTARFRFPFNAPPWMLNSFTVRVFNALYYRRLPSHRDIVSLESYFYPLDGIRDWNKMYGRRGFVQYQFVLPMDRSREGLPVILERLAAFRRSSFLAVLKSFGPANDSPLSFPLRGHTLALDLPFTGASLIQLLHELNAIVIKFGGRVYLAKDAHLNADEFHQMYPRAEEFKQIQRKLDPNDVFASSLSRRIGLT